MSHSGRPGRYIEDSEGTSPVGQLDQPAGVEASSSSSSSSSEWCQLHHGDRSWLRLDNVGKGGAVSAPGLSEVRWDGLLQRNHFQGAVEPPQCRGLNIRKGVFVAAL
eukprot:scaffold155686_cov38-Prasinocladus_malaysianus.AAC.1